ETEIELLRSRRVVEPVVEALALHVEVAVDGESSAPDEAFSAFSAGADAVPGDYRISGEDGRYLATDRRGRTLAEATAGEELRFAGLALQLPARAQREVELTVLPFGEVVEKVRQRIDPAAINPDADVIRLTCSGRTSTGAQALCA